MLYIWEWKNDIISSEYESEKNYQTFKVGKKLNLGNDQAHVTKLADDEDFEQILLKQNDDPNYTKYFSEFEKGSYKGRWIMHGKKQFYQSGAYLKSATYTYNENLLILGYQNGVFGLYRREGTEFINLQIFSVAEEKISHLSINGNGSWIALACKKSSQLMVWEWRSQTFILNQKGSHYDVNC